METALSWLYHGLPGVRFRECNWRLLFTFKKYNYLFNFVRALLLRIFFFIFKHENKPANKSQYICIYQIAEQDSKAVYILNIVNIIQTFL